uniref:trypsin-like peptidase domain-containing protein n=1 Tax=Yoonia sp. TaxID=2212373 RepID=UPI003F6C484F
MRFLIIISSFALSLAAFSGGVSAQVPTQSDARGIPTIAPVIADITDAVVNIAAEANRPMQINPLFQDPLFQEFFDLPDQLPDMQRASVGSGVIVDADEGYVMTNHHVIDGADTISVTLQDGRELDAELVGSDPGTDIAVLKIPAGNLSGLRMGTSDHLLVGDYVVAVGNPFGIGQTVTLGIVSALGRSGINPQGYEDFIQTDASINPGNSGGALVTLDGQLVGINTAIVSRSGGNVGIGFAVPIDMARSVMDQIIEFGNVRRGQLGVMIRDLTPDLAVALDVPIDRGAVVVEVVPESVADDIGLAPGDVITAVNG